ncbi:MAG: hypothetical protein QG671_1491 [Actinomycetota bacterium]|nr:hypothetical protein [Actinomycetota bacterium]
MGGAELLVIQICDSTLRLGSRILEVTVPYGKFNRIASCRLTITWGGTVLFGSQIMLRIMLWIVVVVMAVAR